jgi:mono/diheme cytochrome c family protein
MKSPVFRLVRYVPPLALLIATAILAPVSSAHTRATDVTWTKDIARIVQTRCASCHGGGGAVQTPLATYEDTRTRARAIREEVLEGRMPPWPAARGVGDFSNDRSLSPIEIELLTAWADGNTPLGKLDDRPAPQVTQPTAVPHEALVVPAGHPARGPVERFEVVTDFASSRWIKGWTFQPGNAALVERAVISIVGGDQIGSWVPGEGVIQYPSGVAQRLPARSKLSVEVHYRKSAAETVPESALKLYLGVPARSLLRHRTLACASNLVSQDSEAVAITPLASGAGDSLEVIARRPDGSVQPLVVIPQFQPGDPLTYRFRNSVRLPPDTLLDVRSSSPGCTATLEFTYRRPGRVAGPRP